MEGKIKLRKQGESGNATARADLRLHLKSLKEEHVMQSTEVLTRTIEITDTVDGYRVTPYTHVRKQDKVAFVNSTRGDVTIQFAKSGIFNQSQLRLKYPKEMAKELKVQDEAPEGFHPYSAFCHERGEFAEGGSMPIIILDPKP